SPEGSGSSALEPVAESKEAPVASELDDISAWVSRICQGFDLPGQKSASEEREEEDAPALEVSTEDSVEMGEPELQPAEAMELVVETDQAAAADDAEEPDRAGDVEVAEVADQAEVVEVAEEPDRAEAAEVVEEPEQAEAVAVAEEPGEAV